MTIIRNVQLPLGNDSSLFVELRLPPFARSLLIVCHGICEHSGRYLGLLESLSERGIGSVRFDLRGHGRSTGSRGHIDRFDLYLEDLDSVVRWATSQCVCDHGALPTFLLGHSMGGVIVSRYLQQFGSEGCRGLILSSPGFRASVEIPSYKRALLRLLLPWMPGLRLPTGIPVEGLTSDLGEQRRYREDTQIGSRVSLRWYVEFTREGARALERAPALTLPIYAFCGSEDKVVRPDAVRQFVESTLSSDKTFKIWDGLRHEPLNERLPERDAVTQSVAAWITSRGIRASETDLERRRIESE
ncbi:MAG: alpha/beta hydrolase [Polyangiaceae bacterium]